MLSLIVTSPRIVEDVFRKRIIWTDHPQQLQAFVGHLITVCLRLNLVYTIAVLYCSRNRLDMNR